MKRIAHDFVSGGQVAPLVAVVSASGKDLTSPVYAGQAKAAFARLAAASPGSRLASYATTSDRAFLSQDRHTEFALVFPQPPAQGDSLSSSAISAVRSA